MSAKYRDRERTRYKKQREAERNIKRERGNESIKF